MRGRKPKPSRLKIISGSKQPINENEPQPTAWLDDAPDWFDDLQREYWAHALASAPPMMLSTMDRDILSLWATASAIYQRAGEALNTMVRDGVDEFGDPTEEPLLEKGAQRQSIYITMMNRQAPIIMKACSELGFTPTARTRLSVKPKAPKKNEFDGM